MEKQITIYTETEDGQFIIPYKTMARRVLDDVHPEFNFWLHASITLGSAFTITEGICGYAIAHGQSEKEAIKNARVILKKHDISVIRSSVNQKKELIKSARESYLSDPLWNAFAVSGYTLTQGELADIRQSLEADGYEITKVTSSLK